MAAVISEDHIEQIVIEEFIDLGYSYVNGADISPDGISQERQFDEVVLSNACNFEYSKGNACICGRFFNRLNNNLSRVLKVVFPGLAFDGIIENGANSELI